MTPRVSIVVPTFNNAAFIEATLDSIFGQTYEDFELVIADHSSTDGTWELLRRYAGDPRVRLLRHATPAAAPSATGTEVSDAANGGVFLKLVCASDLLYPDAAGSTAHVPSPEGAFRGGHGVFVPRTSSTPGGRTVIGDLGLARLSHGRVNGTVGACGSPCWPERTSSVSRPACCCAARRWQALGGWHGRPGF